MPAPVTARLFFTAAFAVLLAAASSLAYAQGRPGGPRQDAESRTLDGEVRGIVLDAESQQPIATATVALWRAADSTLVTGAVSGSDGAFLLDRLPAGRYYVQVSFIGYATQTVGDVVLSDQTPQAALGSIRLALDTAQLGDIEVSADRETVEFALDRTVYNTRNQAVSAGGSATDVLRNIPSVEVDVDGNVSLRGSQNVAVLVNGKPSPMRGEFLTAFLQQLPADMIERVEVIPNPSAKYEPDGMAGILNIVLKQDADLGTSGGLTLSAGTGDKYNASTNLNLQKGKVSLFANYGFRYEDRSSEGYNFRENRYLDPLTYLEQANDGLRNNVSHLLNATADYTLTPRSVLSASALVSTRTGDSEDLNAYGLLGTGGGLTDRYDRLSLSESNGVNTDYKLSFRRTVEASVNELTADLRYNRSVGDDFDRFRQQALTLTGAPANGTPERQTNALDTEDSEWALQVDYTRPVGAGLKLETGYKGEWLQMDNVFYAERFDYDRGTFLAEETLNNTFLFDEHIHAAYGILSGSLGAFEWQGGARVEQARTTFDLTTTNTTYDNDYASVFPSAFAAYKLTDARQVKLSYSKRINRPRTRMLNPFTSYTDPLNLYVGNPYLKPEYVHAVELAFQQFTKRGTISLTPYFRRTVDKMERYKTVAPDGVSTLTFRNFDTSDSYGAELVGSLRLGRALRGFASFNAYKVVTDGSNVDGDLSNDAFSWSSRISATWQVRDGLDVQAFYFYRAPINVAQGRISSFSVANLAVQQKLLNDKATLSLRLSDPLDRMGFRFEIDDLVFYQEGRRKWESRIAYLTFTYTFGQQPKRRPSNDRSGDDGGFNDVGIG